MSCRFLFDLLFFVVFLATHVVLHTTASLAPGQTHPSTTPTTGKRFINLIFNLP
jgi:hypothetical protein